MDHSRRNFFKRYCLGKAAKLVDEVTTSFKEGASDTDYFDSYETCYHQIS